MNKEIIKKISKTIKDEGFKAILVKGKRYLKRTSNHVNTSIHYEYTDILFVNGCSLLHPQRYRVDHQIEQLKTVGISTKKVYYDQVNKDMAKYCRAIVVFRCPIIPSIKELIEAAKLNNKVVFYDIDDLVFDVNDVKNLDVIKKMSIEDRNLYLDGVKRMGQTLDLCDYAIASTNRLKTEMKKHVKDVFINRNVASEEMVKYSQEALKMVKKDDNKIVIGYLSGSITHNADFDMIKPVIIDILKKYENVYLRIGGLLDIPEDMNEVKNKILLTEFVDWKKLPQIIASIDINIAPLEDSIFNEAKSENKWTEAALVKVPTIASKVGAFKDEIKHNKTGVLCEDNKEWEKYLTKMIENESYRNEIANNAYNEVMSNHTTLNNGAQLKDFICSKLNKNIFFVLPSTNISGGVLVAIKHAQILKNNSYDVTIINAQPFSDNIVNKYGSVNVIPAPITTFNGYVDTLVATMWLTLEFALQYSRNNNIKYLVQGYETNFYNYGDINRLLCESTYNKELNVDYITISKWCNDWLTNKYHNEVNCSKNGIDLTLFKNKKRTFKGKIKVLVEGNSNDYYKNVDESFKIVEKLDHSKFEIHYLSYEKEPKKWYKVDKFYHKIPHDEVGKIYQSADILLKTSIFESFSYPPLEMMATGGTVVALKNDGNSEYLIDRENCLFYEQGNYDDAVSKINEIVTNKELRDRLIENGLKTAKSRDWKNIEKEIIDLYNC